MALCLLSIVGCGGKGKTKGDKSPAPGKDQPAGQLEAGYRSLESRQFDAALTSADAYLKSQPKGADAAAAHYLRGRALEQRVATDPAQSIANLSAARAEYVQALARKPEKELAAYIQTSLGNVAFFQDDYTTALTAFTTAYPLLDNQALRPWVQYRIGVCQKRLGRHGDADLTFAAVLRDHPGTEAADRAREQMGNHQFFVQVGTFRSPENARKAVDDLKSMTIAATTSPGPAGTHVVRAGPYATYDQARQARLRVLPYFVDALIVP